MYQLKIPAHDEQVRITKNGVTIFSALCCSTNPPAINVGLLGSNDSLQITEINGIGNYPLKVYFIRVDTSKITPFVDSSCNKYSTGNVSGTTFIPLSDSATGYVVAAVNPNGVSTGTITVNMKHAAPGATNIPVGNLGVLNMPRYFNFKSSNYSGLPFPTAITVRLYYLLTEFDDYKVATNQPSLTIADLQVSHYDGINQDCNAYNNNPVIDTLRLLGWGYTGANAFYIDVNTTRFSEFGVSRQLNILPVTWLYADAVRKNKTTEIKWQVASELDSRGFEILRSNDGSHFKTIATVASKGNNSTPVTYNFNDENIPQTSPYLYYRIKQTDKDNRYSFSQVMKVKVSNNAVVTLFPNPAKDFTTISASSIINRYTIMEMSGRIVETKPLLSNNALINTAFLPKGIYILTAILSSGEQQTFKMVKY